LQGNKFTIFNYDDALLGVPRNVGELFIASEDSAFRVDDQIARVHDDFKDIYFENSPFDKRRMVWHIDSESLF
jgi:hypothetical protein